jgi:hypothetical protein
MCEIICPCTTRQAHYKKYSPDALTPPSGSYFSALIRDWYKRLLSQRHKTFEDDGECTRLALKLPIRWSHDCELPLLSVHLLIVDQLV